MTERLALPDVRYMKEAVALAEEAGKYGEIPVGAVIVKDGKILSCGRNRREEKKNALQHAEIEAIEKACQALGDWRLSGCTLYVTLEPCIMCAGAIVNARIDQVFFGAYDAKAGACGSVTDLFALPNHFSPKVWGGVMEEACAALMEEFFKKIRK